MLEKCFEQVNKVTNLPRFITKVDKVGQDGARARVIGGTTYIGSQLHRVRGVRAETRDSKSQHETMDLVGSVKDDKLTIEKARGFHQPCQGAFRKE